MSDDENYSVGRGRPPKEHQFKKGQTGNGRGRPRKPRRLPIPSQRARDVLRVRELPISIKTPQGEITLTLGEAIIYSIGKRALTDKVSYARDWMRLEEHALQWLLSQHRELKLAELLHKIIDEKAPGRDRLSEKTLDAIIAKWIKRHR